MPLFEFLQPMDALFLDLLQPFLAPSGQLRLTFRIVFHKLLSLALFALLASRHGGSKFFFGLFELGLVVGQGCGFEPLAFGLGGIEHADIAQAGLEQRAPQCE